MFFSSITVLTPNGNFWIVPLLHSVSDTNFGLISSQYCKCCCNYKITMRVWSCWYYLHLLLCCNFLLLC